jgi:hypothetical protein
MIRLFTLIEYLQMRPDALHQCNCATSQRCTNPSCLPQTMGKHLTYLLGFKKLLTVQLFS